MINQDEILTLLDSFKNGDEKSLDKIFEEFKPMVSSISRGYFLVGGDEEDLVQEGMIGLYKAIQTYNQNQKTTFQTFAYLCVLRQVQMAVRDSQRKKRQNLNSYVPITDQGMIIVDQENENGIYLLSDELNPEESLIETEQKNELTKMIKNILSEFEFNVLSLYLKGYSHLIIAKKLNKDLKSVSNAIARMRDKLQNFFGGENVSSTLS